MNKLFFSVKLGLLISASLHFSILMMPAHSLKSTHWIQLGFPILFLISAVISRFIDQAMIKRNVRPRSIYRGRDMGPIGQAPPWFNTLRRRFYYYWIFVTLFAPAIKMFISYSVSGQNNFAAESLIIFGSVYVIYPYLTMFGILQAYKKIYGNLD